MPCRILDRTRLILDIFMSRARTAYAKTQVQLANYEYMLPRLSGMWTHLERQRGGTGTRGGAGERESRPTAVSSATGSPNSRRICRKSTVRWPCSARTAVRWCVWRWWLYQRGQVHVDEPDLQKRGVCREQTLCNTRHDGAQGGFRQPPFLLSDTVGFIRKLPTELIESFKSTLDEVREADLLVHVVDIRIRSSKSRSTW